jgi:hypothetical protein
MVDKAGFTDERRFLITLIINNKIVTLSFKKQALQKITGKRFAGSRKIVTFAT